MESLDDDVV